MHEVSLASRRYRFSCIELVVGATAAVSAVCAFWTGSHALEYLAVLAAVSATSLLVARHLLTH